ncbi:MAG: alpha/beta hydrolase [Bacteroidota bacterium]
MKKTTTHKAHTLLLLLMFPLCTLAQGNQLRERRFIPINGIEQWITITGDKTKPAILFIHGGPGSTMSPYADNVYQEWEKYFVLIHWDQRGAGKTYGRTAPDELSPAYLKANPLTVDQVTDDGIKVAEYMIKYLGKQKLTLFGTSWGSIPAVEMAVKRPDLFNGYVGHSQVVEPLANLISDYVKISALVNKINDQQSAEVLTTIGAPPYASAKNAGQLFKIIKKYERMASTPAPDAWWKLAPEYDNAKDNQNREDGDDYSFVNYVGDSKLGVKPMMATINFAKDHWQFKIPVYLVQGEEDILTPAEITKVYFTKIKAPVKQFILVPKAAHGFNEAVLDAQLKAIKQLNGIK